MKLKASNNSMVVEYKPMFIDTAMADNISIKRIDSGVYFIVEEINEMHYSKEVVIDLESDTLEEALSDMGCSMTIDSDTGVSVTDSTGLIHEQEGALRIIALATYNS